MVRGRPINLDVQPFQVASGRFRRRGAGGGTAGRAVQEAALDQAADRARMEGQLDDFQGARARSISRSGSSGASDWTVEKAARPAGDGIETNRAETRQSLGKVRNRLAPRAIGRKYVLATIAGP